MSLDDEAGDGNEDEQKGDVSVDLETMTENSIRIILNQNSSSDS